jgi:trehalose 6-phosphate synthase
VGWAGVAVDDPQPLTPPDIAPNCRLVDVPLTPLDVTDYYEGFANATLWPLYHDRIVAPTFHRGWWRGYERVNRLFAEAVAAVAPPGAMVWVHDYQLQLVPAILRGLRPDVRIGFFLHIPFPPTELFLQLPWRRQITEGLLGADVIGFQLPGAVRNFLEVAHRLVGAEVGPGRAIVRDGDALREVRVDAFPISVDAAALGELGGSAETATRAARIRSDLGGPEHLLLGVDRLDYTKGIDVRMRAFVELIADGALSPSSVVLLQIATPTRENVEEYQRLRDEIEGMVGRALGAHSHLGEVPLRYVYNSVPREEIAAFYRAADVMLVTPLRDGMNLVAKEYVACRVDGGGSLVLSEFTGAARELTDAWLVNPYSLDSVKRAIMSALQAPVAENRRRMRAMREVVRVYDVERWARTFLAALGARAHTRAG